MPEIHKGLEDIYIDRSSISRVFGSKGKLTYRGYWIEDLAEQASYEEVAYLLIEGELPDEDELERFSDTLKEYRELDDTVKDLIRDMQDTSPMDVLRTAVSATSKGTEAGAFHVEQNRERGLKIIAKVPTIVAELDRVRKDRDPVEPRDDLGHAANFYYMLHDEEPSAVEAEAVDTALILYAEHGMNASTFAACVTASTEAKRRQARELGADRAIDYTERDFAERVRELTDKRGVDVVVDHVGERTWPDSLASLAKGGRLLTCGATTGPTGETDIRRVFWNQLDVRGSTMATPGEVDDVLSLVWDGTLEPHVRERLPMSESDRAHELLAEREGFGKVVVIPDSEL